MIRKTRPVTSREYKVMLRAKRFDGSKKDTFAAAESFRDAFARAIMKSVVSNEGDPLAGGKFEPLEDEKQVTVQFFDTKDRRLRKSNFVFRQRQPVTGGPLELTLKRRHPDRFFVSGSETGRKTKFEEDIKATQAHDFISLHSLSGKVKEVAADTEFKSLKDIRGFFKPLKKQLGNTYNRSEKLLRVCNFIAIQTVLEGVVLPISDQIRAECALIVWHQKGGDAESPAVVEFSFRHRDKELGSKQEPFTAEMAKRCFDVLQALRDEDSPVAKWVNLKGPTKTAYAYGLTRT
jgi:hypothetical protein